MSQNIDLPLADVDRVLKRHPDVKTFLNEIQNKSPFGRFLDYEVYLTPGVHFDWRVRIKCILPVTTLDPYNCPGLVGIYVERSFFYSELHIPVVLEHFLQYVSMGMLDKFRCPPFDKVPFMKFDVTPGVVNYFLAKPDKPEGQA